MQKENKTDLGFNWRMINIVHNPFAGWIVLGLSLTITVVAYNISSRLAKSEALTRFEYRSDEIVNAIEERLDVYEQVLRSGVALIDSQELVTREEWKKFANTLNLEKHWPGIQGLGYSIPVKPENLEAHINQVKSEGYPSYELKPEGVRDLYTAIIYLEPFDWRNKRAFGYDMWSNDVRKEAMSRARDTGDAATSGRITLVQETETDVQHGFLTYLPVYQSGALPSTIEARRQELIGWVYAAFRAGDLMSGIIGEADPSIEFEIYDGNTVGIDHLLFDSNDSPHYEEIAHEPVFTRTSPLTLQGRPWTIYLNTPLGNTSIIQNDQPKFILIGGIIIDILLFYVIVSLYSINKKAENIADELTQEYRQATEREAKANKAKSQFLANMSHELRTPLNSIIGFTQILNRKLDGKVGSRELQAIDTVGRNGKHLLTLINEILDLSKVEAGRMEIDASDFDFIETIKAELPVWEQKANAKGLAFVARIEFEKAAMFSDKRKILQIIDNLMSNAIKYTEVGRVEISFALSYSQQDLNIVVKDTGRGISQKDQEKLFKQYYRAESVRKEALEGTGLGLLISANFVELLGGSIQVESELGKGTSFTINIPCNLNIQESQPAETQYPITENKNIA